MNSESLPISPEEASEEPIIQEQEQPHEDPASEIQEQEQPHEDAPVKSKNNHTKMRPVKSKSNHTKMQAVKHLIQRS